MSRQYVVAALVFSLTCLYTLIAAGAVDAQPTPTKPAPPVNSAQIRVIVPDSEAQVFFDNVPTRLTGTERRFRTPVLEANGPNSYTVRCTYMKDGREVSEERTVKVLPGATVIVDFTQQNGEQPTPKDDNRPQQSGKKERSLEGKVVRTIGQDQFVVQANDREITVYTYSQTRFMFNSKAGTFSDLRAGNSVNVDFRLDGNRHIGTKVTIES